MDPSLLMEEVYGPTTPSGMLCTVFEPLACSNSYKVAAPYTMSRRPHVEDVFEDTDMPSYYNQPPTDSSLLLEEIFESTSFTPDTASNVPAVVPLIFGVPRRTFSRPLNAVTSSSAHNDHCKCLFITTQNTL